MLNYFVATKRRWERNGARLWSQTQPQHVRVSTTLDMSDMLRLVLRTQPRSVSNSLRSL
jgi:hypothetical protein